MSNALPLPFPWVPGQAPVEGAEFQERVQQNFDHVSTAVGQHLQYPSWVAPTLSNSWVAFGASDSQPGYYKDAHGIVRLRGLVKNGSSASAIITTLPAGYRPALNSWFATTANNAFCSIKVTSGGEVNAQAGGSTTWISLDGITFRAEQ